MTSYSGIEDAASTFVVQTSWNIYNSFYGMRVIMRVNCECSALLVRSSLLITLMHSGLPQWEGGRSEGMSEICSNCEIFNTGRSMELISANRTLFLTVLSCVEVV